MGVKLGTMYFLSSSSNELERKGIPRDSDNGASPDRAKIPQVTRGELLKYGEQVLEQMQNEQLDTLAREHLSLGNEFDRTIESARIKQTYAMQQLAEQQMKEFEPDLESWRSRKYFLVPLNITLLYITFKYP